MSTPKGTLHELINRRPPELRDAITARNDDEFERTFEIILEQAITALERDKTNFSQLNEDGLSGILVVAFNMAGLPATREAHSNGHVDLTIDAAFGGFMRRKLGEAKIYNGPAYHVEGLEQLLGRYTTGRETRGLLIEYVKQADIAGLIKKIREKMDSEKPMRQQGDTQDNSLKWSFVSVHRHSCGDDLQVAHYGCNLYVEAADDAKAAAKAK